MEISVGISRLGDVGGYVHLHLVGFWSAVLVPVFVTEPLASNGEHFACGLGTCICTMSYNQVQIKF